MRRFSRTAVVSTLAIGFAAIAFVVPASAQPAGWQCSYAITPLHHNSRKIYYACYGSQLRRTRARARAECSGLFRCITGACIPLNYTPEPYCRREG